MFRFFKTVVFLARMYVTVTYSETESLRFCSVKIYIDATNVLFAEKNLRLVRFVLLKNT